MKNYKFLLDRDLPECSKACVKHDVSCPVEDCRQWIDYEGDLNCTSIAVEKHGSMTLRLLIDCMLASCGLSRLKTKCGTNFKGIWQKSLVLTREN